MKPITALILSVVLFTTIAMFNPAFAQSSQASYTVNLTYSTIQVTYPSQVLPGDSVSVNVQVNPKNNVNLQTLTATVYYVDETGLHQLTTQTLADNSQTNNYGYGYAHSTSSFSKSFQVTVPQNAPRTSLEAMFSETAQSGYYNNYYAYPYYYGYPDYNYSCSHWYCEYSNVYPFYAAYYPSYTSTSTDNAIAPLSYVKASTPEYATLQTQYTDLQSQNAGLQSQYQSLQQQLQQSQAQNQQLQSTVSQQNITINQLNQQLASSNSNTQTYQLLAVGLGILVIALAVFAAFRGRSKTQVVEPQTKERKGN
jgi:hypothetical protein